MKYINNINICIEKKERRREVCEYLKSMIMYVCIYDKIKMRDEIRMNDGIEKIKLE